MINDEDLSLESFKKLKQLEEKINEKTKKNENRKKEEDNKVKNFMQLKLLEHSLPHDVRKKVKSLKIDNMKDLGKLAVTKKKKFFVKILEHKDLKHQQKRKQK
ncbi:Uncharacterized protein PCOAH_00028710 [Plasmodium coatneyi]|uniref:Uncharacterized protein n=1 Tax=Plasmodium coatneyi TaxID=208452 RepID=A0A1B1E155_9APIC|nr:Uncharacterized protein PCOAH_00028710 [Plasmodium coatneyi]ANQ08754.1 Uncharacterized protein PCOAH_00028710 [Plasmodium coatneyi]